MRGSQGEKKVPRNIEKKACYRLLRRRREQLPPFRGTWSKEQGERSNQLLSTISRSARTHPDLDHHCAGRKVQSSVRIDGLRFAALVPEIFYRIDAREPAASESIHAMSLVGGTLGACRFDVSRITLGKTTRPASRNDSWAMLFTI